VATKGSVLLHSMPGLTILETDMPAGRRCGLPKRRRERRQHCVTHCCEEERLDGRAGGRALPGKHRFISHGTNTATTLRLRQHYLVHLRASLPDNSPFSRHPHLYPPTATPFPHPTPTPHTTPPFACRTPSHCHHHPHLPHPASATTCTPLAHPGLTPTTCHPATSTIALPAPVFHPLPPLP